MAVEGVNLNTIYQLPTSKQVAWLNSGLLSPDQEQELSDYLKSSGIDVNEYEVEGLTDYDINKVTGQNDKAMSTEDRKDAYNKAAEEQRDGMESHGEDQTSGENVRSVVAGASAIGGIASLILAGKSALANGKGDVRATIIGSAVLAANIALDATVAANKPHATENEDIKQGIATDLPAAQASMEESQQAMEESLANAEAFAEKAEEMIEEINDEMAEREKDYLSDKDVYDSRRAAVESGDADECDIEDLNNLGETLSEYGETNDKLVDEGKEIVNDVAEEMDAEIETFDTAAENVESARAVTDIYQNLGEATESGANQDKTNFKILSTTDKVLAGAQGINAGLLFAKGAAEAATWQWVPAAIHNASAIISTANAAGFVIESSRMSKHADAQAEIADTASEMLKINATTQAMTQATEEQYNDNIDSYADAMAFVEHDIVMDEPGTEFEEDIPETGETGEGASSETENGQGATTRSGAQGGAQTPTTGETQTPTTSGAQGAQGGAQAPAAGGAQGSQGTDGKDENDGTDKVTGQADNDKPAETTDKDDDYDDKVKKKDDVK